jgi:hypothetical protein
MEKPMNGATRYADIQRILDDAVGQTDLPTHGPFWRTLSRDDFVAHSVFGCRIIFSENDRFVGAQSPLVQILRAAIECPPSRRRPRMPRGLPPVPEEKISVISDWIDAQCPA